MKTDFLVKQSSAARSRRSMTALLLGILLSGVAIAGVTVERQTTLTDDNGGQVVTIGTGEFERPGSEFNITATFSDFQPRQNGPMINGQLRALSSVAGGGGAFTRRAARTTVINGEVNLTDLPRGDEDVALQLIDLTVADQQQGPRRGFRRGAEQGDGSWSGTVIINGNEFTPQELPRPARELLRHILGILRH